MAGDPPTDLPRSADVVVVGGGVVGTACAYHLSRLGLSVVLVERAGVAAGSSSATQSLVGYGLGGSAQHLELQIAAMAAYDEIVADGMQFWFDRSGAIVVPEDADDAEALELAVEDRRRLGLRPQLLARAQLRELEPALAPEGERGAFLPELAQVSPMELAIELARQSERLGARIACNTTFNGLDLGSRGSVAAVVTTRGLIQTPRLVLAAGSWSRDVGKLAQVDVAVWPRKGHVLVAEPVPGLLTRPVVDFGYGRTQAAPVEVDDAGPRPGPAAMFGVLQPLPSGQMLVGGSRQFAGIDLGVDQAVVREIARRAVRIVPALAGVRAIRTYVGFRPWTPDGAPLIGPVARVPGLMLATGHGGEGITESVVTGRIVADLIGGRTPPVDVGPLSPARFAA